MSDQSTATPPPGSRHRVRQSPKRGHYDRESLYAVLDACPIGHVSIVDQSRPVSIPTAIARIGSSLYLHGSRSSRLYMALAAGAATCVSVCRVDGLVKARSAFHCSMNYRSAVVFGQADVVSDAHKAALLDDFTERLIPGTRGQYREHLAKELKATELLRLALDEASVKIRTGDPVDDPGDETLPHWAGVIPVQEVYGEPVPAADLDSRVSAFRFQPDGFD